MWSEFKAMSDKQKLAAWVGVNMPNLDAYLADKTDTEVRLTLNSITGLRVRGSSRMQESCARFRISLEHLSKSKREAVDALYKVKSPNDARSQADRR